jgi:hypothetical protein
MPQTTYDAAERLALTSVATPKRTTIQTVAWSLPECILDEVHIIIPAGAVGLTGLRIVYQGTPIIPWNSTAFIVGNNEVVKLPVGIHVSKPLSVITQNNDTVAPHTHYLRGLYHDVPLVTDTGPNPELAQFVFGA